MEENNEVKKDKLDPEALANLTGFFSLLMEISKKDIKRKKQLKKEPEGFHLENDGYQCMICRNGMKVEDSWYDWYGFTCLICRRAIKENVIPAFICQKSNSYFKAWHLKYLFGIHPQTAKKMARLGELKARIIINNEGKPYEYIFLKKENPQLVDPERDNPVLKSWKRNRDKVLDARIRKEKVEARVEMEKLMAKSRKQ